MMPPSRLLDLVSQPSERAIPDGMVAVGRALLKEYEAGALGVLLYGSCLRAKSDQDSLVDCYVLVENYSLAYHSMWLAVTNWILPPNVFYLNVPFSNRHIRVKYAVLSLSDFERGVSPRWFHSYFWARFAQPTVLFMPVAPELKCRVFQGLAQAVCTFLEKSLPGMESSFTAEELWQKGWRLTYGAEFRSESAERGKTLWAFDREYYEQVTQVVLGNHSSAVRLHEEEGKIRYSAHYSESIRLVNQMGWMIRTVQGKILSMLRLMKAAFTFQGGADYLIWKIERHSGVKVELTPTQRRHPIITGLVIFWRLYRQGAFR